MKVAICGFYGKSNFGDDLMADCLAARLSCGVHEVGHYSDNSVGGIRNGLRDKSYLDADVVVVGGGNIIGPGFWAFKDGGIDELARVRNLVFLNVGVTPDYLSDRDFAAKLAKLQATWRVRDAESVELLSGIGIRAEYLPDISFTLRGEGKKTGDKTLLVCLNDYPFGDLHKDTSVEKFLRATSAAKMVAHHLDWMADFGWQVRFAPCHVSNAVDDRLPAASVYGWMRRRDAAEPGMSPLGWQDLLNEIAGAGLVVSMRYHASTCALAQGVPLLDLTHHAKNIRLLKSLNAEKCSVNVWGCTHEDMIRATQEAERFGPGPGLGLTEEADRLWRLFDAEWRAMTIGGDQEYENQTQLSLH